MNKYYADFIINGTSMGRMFFTAPDYVSAYGEARKLDAMFFNSDGIVLRKDYDK